MADDVFTGTSREFEVVGYHRAVGATVIKIIRGFFGGIGSIFKLMTRLIGTKAIVEEPEPEPVTMMASIYDSISSAMSGSNSTSAPAKTSGKKPISKSAPLRSQKNLPKATTRGGALGKKSIMEDLVKGGSSSAFDSEDSSIDIVETIQSYLPSTSRLAKLLPTLVAGFVFTTAGTLVGYLWNTEFAATASSYVDYFWVRRARASLKPTPFMMPRLAPPPLRATMTFQPRAKQLLPLPFPSHLVGFNLAR